MSSTEQLAGGKLRLDRPADHVARLTLENPGKRNALDHEILEALASTIPRIDARCLLVTAVGGVFSAGYDIGNLPREQLADEAAALVAHPFSTAIAALDAFPHPTVAALNGHAIGGGLELALTCDLRVAAAGARLGMPPARLGLIYSHTGLRRFIDVCGVAATNELFLVGRNVDAERAERMGLVNRLVPAEELERAALDMAMAVAAGAPLSLAGNKRVIRALRAHAAKLPEEVERELVDLRESCFRSEDFREGVSAFAEKRAPVWRGR